jgi:hypothetical protein
MMLVSADKSCGPIATAPVDLVTDFVFSIKKASTREAFFMVAICVNDLCKETRRIRWLVVAGRPRVPKSGPSCAVVPGLTRCTLRPGSTSLRSLAQACPRSCRCRM